VLNISDIYHDKLYDNIEYAQQLLLTNPLFKEKIYAISLEICPNITEKNKTILEEYIFISLFSYSAFYITHQCVCQQFKQNNIDVELLNKINDYLNTNSAKFQSFLV
jgi:hypothetical protein